MSSLNFSHSEKMTNESLPLLGPSLVEPHEPATNDGHDNVNYELIVHRGMEIINSKQHCYRVDENLGKGESGTVFKVTLLSPEKKEMGEYALKISNSDLPSVNRIEYECKVLEFVCFYRKMINMIDFFKKILSYLSFNIFFEFY